MTDEDPRRFNRFEECLLFKRGLVSSLCWLNVKDGERDMVGVWGAEWRALGQCFEAIFW